MICPRSCFVEIFEFLSVWYFHLITLCSGGGWYEDMTRRGPSTPAEYADRRLYRRGLRERQGFVVKPEGKKVKPVAAAPALLARVRKKEQEKKERVEKEKKEKGENQKKKEEKEKDKEKKEKVVQGRAVSRSPPIRSPKSRPHAALHAPPSPRPSPAPPPYHLALTARSTPTRSPLKALWGWT